jgi:Cu(I)/Ag(I) efflux system membrane fusion protein
LRDGRGRGIAQPPRERRCNHGDVMSKRRIMLAFAFALGLGAAGEYWLLHRALPSPLGAAQAAERRILYYRDPGGAPRWSAVPARDAQGRDYLPVYDDEEPSFGANPAAGPAAAAKPAPATRRILYYRNPMGLPDVSPVPKKDQMGMNYIPVYEGEEPADDRIVKVSLDRVQRSGVRSEKVETRALVQPVRAVGTVAIDESRQTVVALRSEGYIEALFVDTTGRTVRAGEPLFRVYSPDIVNAQINLEFAARTQAAPADGPRGLEGATQRLRNLGVPESRIREVIEKHLNPRTLDWPAPASGTVTAKRVVNGQRVQAGDELYRIVDLTRMWVIADVAEADLALVKPGTRARVTFRAYPAEPVEGTVTLVYPELKAETRTARVRIEVANPDGRLKTDMYADVVFQAGDAAPVVAVPDGAVIDSGTRQIVLVVRGEGRFEPRPVRLGRHGEGYREVLDGVAVGEEIVTTATFLIDAESNLQAALKAFAPPPERTEPPP